MKYETSERLYTEGMHILTTLCVTVPLSLIGVTCQTLIIYAMSGLAYEFLPLVLGWTLLLFCFHDAIFRCVAAAAPDGQQARTMATTFLVLSACAGSPRSRRRTMLCRPSPSPRRMRPARAGRSTPT